MKTLLFIAPYFFSYEKYIANELEKLGYKVYIIYENVEEFSYLSKLMIKLKGDKQTYYDNYYKKKISSIKFDLVLVIRGSFLSLDVINYIKEYSPNAKFYMYQWDSVNNNSNALEIASSFDQVSTFDIHDAEKYKWNYRPLFYINSSSRVGSRKYDVAYICTLHSQRIRVFQKLKKIDGKKYLYLYSKFSHFIKERYFHKNIDFDGISLNDVEFKPLSLEQVNVVMGESNIIIDYTHPAQTGFTMRTCESIGHRCKLVTNNKLVKEADFYNENNIYIYDTDNFEIPDSFLKIPFTELPQEVFNRYSISSWIKEIIDYE